MQDWSQLLNRSDVLILDTETTGLGAQDEIVELAIIDTNGTVKFDNLIQPTIPIPEEASRIHGITDDILQDDNAVSWNQYHVAIVSLLTKASFVLIYNSEELGSNGV